MSSVSSDNVSNYQNRPGIVLLVTLVLLIVLSTLGYTLSSRLAAQRHRCQYLIDYQAARYGCDSAVKYARATLEDIKPQLISRPNEPDFSDLFHLTEQEYEEFLAEWAALKAFQTDETLSDINDTNDVNYISYIPDINDIPDTNDINNISDFDDIGGITDFNDPNALVIRGPYGPPWPLVTEPIEVEIGPATVKIEVEDENAKYPLGWMLLGDKEVEREVLAGFETFCEWMDVNELHIYSLELELEELSEIKHFEVKFEPLTKRVRQSTGSKDAKGSSRGRTSRRSRYQYTTKSVSVSKQMATQAADFGRLFHSSLIDTELLARPTVISDRRKESALKYTGMWGSRKVNINTAPRHVLEAAFIFGGDADKIAEEIIQRRRIKPFTDITDLRNSLLEYSDSIRDCEDYITTVSNFFTIKVTAVSGVAEASAIIAITKEGKETTKIAIISG